MGKTTFAALPVVQTREKLEEIYNGNWTEWSAIWSEIIRVISKSDESAAQIRFEITSMISDQNCTTRNSIVNSNITWDQALFSFRFENYIPTVKTKRKESLIQTFNEMSAAHFFDWLTLMSNYLANICRISPSESLPLLVFLVCKFFTRGKNSDWLT